MDACKEFASACGICCGLRGGALLGSFASAMVPDQARKGNARHPILGRALEGSDVG